MAILSGVEDPLVELSFQYGRNLGLAFQFVDDLLDFVSSSEQLGKPAAADLKLGLATAPVLFACEKVSHYNLISHVVIITRVFLVQLTHFFDKYTYCTFQKP